MSNTNDYCDPAQDQEPELKFIAMLTVGLSAAGALFILALFLRHKTLRNFSFLLVAHVSLSDLIFCIGHFLDLDDDAYILDETTPFLCIAQGFLIQYGQLSSIMWTAMIAFSLYSTVVLNFREVHKKYPRFLLWCYGFPLILSIIPFFGGMYGDAGHWCWITLHNHPYYGQFLRFFCFYVPLWVIICFNIYSYGKVIHFLRTFVSEGPEKSFISRLRTYPLILIICWLFPTINTIYTVFNCETKEMNYLHFVTAGLQGFFNSIAYGRNYTTRDILKLTFSSCFPCCVKPPHLDKERQNSVAIGERAVELGEKKMTFEEYDMDKDFYEDL